jgi:TatA/E family protein of Tat protein translocase
MFDLGMQELIVIFIVALLVFGPKKLPELGKTLGKAMHELRRAFQGVKNQMDSEFNLTYKPDAHVPPLSASTTEEKKEETGAPNTEMVSDGDKSHTGGSQDNGMKAQSGEGNPPAAHQKEGR